MGPSAPRGASGRRRIGDQPLAIFADILGDEPTPAIEGLPEDFRTMVILCDIEGLTYEEIAEFVDSPVGTRISGLGMELSPLL